MNYTTLPSKETIQRTLAALNAHKITGHFVESKEEALELLKSLIPASADLMTGASATLEQIGFTALLKSGQHQWKNLKDEILKETDALKQAELRKRSILATYYVGSAHAVTETGEVLAASATGSQIAPYAYASDNVIWVMGAHKIVPTVNDGIRRIREYTYPLEDKRMKSVGYPGSVIGMILIFERPTLPNRTVNLILVNQVLGF